MTHPIPQPGRYREKDTDYAVEVLGCTGTGSFDYVSVHIPAKHQTKTYHVLLGRFWDDYEEVQLMEDNDLLDAYTEVFVMGDEDGGELMPHFECSRCERDVSDDPCPDHAPTGAPGMRLVECWSEPKHQLWVTNRDDYGHPCPMCRLIPYIEKETADRQCKHWAWRRTGAWRWLVGTAYSLGIISGSGASWGDGHDWCTTISSFRGQRPYILGVSRNTWRCWLKGHHRRGDDLGMFGFCSKCLPCSACGSKRFDHEAGCTEAVS